MHITMTFNQGFSSIPVREWLKTKFGSARPERLHACEQTWEVSDEHTEQTVEDDIMETWPLDWPMTGIWISDRNGKES